jgi:hypothetical protein
MDSRAFQSSLQIALKKRYGRLPTAKRLVQDIYLHSSGNVNLSNEAVRKWITGQSIPRGEHMLYLAHVLGQDDFSWLKSYKDSKD